MEASSLNFTHLGFTGLGNEWKWPMNPEFLYRLDLPIWKHNFMKFLCFDLPSI